MAILQKYTTCVFTAIPAIVLNTAIFTSASAYCIDGDSPYVKHTFPSQWKLGWSHVFFPARASEAKVFWEYLPSDALFREIDKNEKIKQKIHVLAKKHGSSSGTSVLLDSRAVNGDALKLYDRVAEKLKSEGWNITIVSPDKHIAGFGPKSAVINWDMAPKWEQAIADFQKDADGLENSLCSHWNTS